MAFLVYIFACGKGKIHGEIKLIVYSLQCYCPTCIISLALLVLRPKLVLFLTDVLSKLSFCFSFCFLLSLSFLRGTATFILPPYRNTRGMIPYTRIF